MHYLVSDLSRRPVHRVDSQVGRLLAAQGVTFINAFATTPLCCPSRSSILTGLYTHNHGVVGNFPPIGGAPRFVDTSTIATWLERSGYRTALIGKYLNAYNQLLPFPHRPPGWTTWRAFKVPQYTNYTLVEDSTQVLFGSATTDYSTDVLAGQVKSLPCACLQVDEANVPGNPAEGPLAARAINRVLDAFDGQRAVHLCFGNYGGQTVQKGTWAKLIDYLLSPAVEDRLAKGPSAQIPLNKLATEHSRAGRISDVRPLPVDWRKAAELFPDAASRRELLWETPRAVFGFGH